MQGRFGGRPNAFEEERHPVACETHPVQQFVVRRPMLLQEQAEVQQRLTQQRRGFSDPSGDGRNVIFISCMNEK